MERTLVKFLHKKEDILVSHDSGKPPPPPPPLVNSECRRACTEPPIQRVGRLREKEGWHCPCLRWRERGGRTQTRRQQKTLGLYHSLTECVGEAGRVWAEGWGGQVVERYSLLENYITQYRGHVTYYSEWDPPWVESQYVAHSPDTAQEVGQGKE
jgi:hypothetical protein